MNPSLEFSQHLRRRMAQRKITREDVEVTVWYPDTVRRTADRETGEPSLLYTRTMQNGGTLKVWIVPPTPGVVWIVKSAAWKDVDDE